MFRWGEKYSRLFTAHDFNAHYIFIQFSAARRAPFFYLPVRDMRFNIAQNTYIYIYISHYSLVDRTRIFVKNKNKT